MELREGQVWMHRRPDLLKSSGHIKILGIGREGLIRIERYYPDHLRARKDWITPNGLRQRYRLLHEQERLL